VDRRHRDRGAGRYLEHQSKPPPGPPTLVVVGVTLMLGAKLACVLCPPVAPPALALCWH